MSEIAKVWRPAAKAGAEADCRCLCGSLLARVVAGGVELKCRRCKRTLVVPLVDDSMQRGPRPRAQSPDRTREVACARGSSDGASASAERGDHSLRRTGIR